MSPEELAEIERDDNARVELRLAIARLDPDLFWIENEVTYVSLDAVLDLITYMGVR